MSDPHDITVRAQTLGGQWEVVGVDRLRGIVPESVQLTANEWGPDTCSFALRGQTGPIRADLSAWTPIEVDVAGRTVWDGRITETPTQDGLEGRTVSVQAQGWQYHLDDDVYEKTYVHTSLSDWQDIRSYVTANLTIFTATPTVTAGSGAIVLAFPANTSAASGDRAAAMLDLGPGAATNGAKRLVIAWEAVNVTANQILRLSSDTAAGGTTTLLTSVTLAATGASSGTTAVTLAGSGQRYLAIQLVQNGAAFTPTADEYVRITSAQVFTDTAYESGNVSILKADAIVSDALTQATVLLSADRSGIIVGTIAIPEYTSQGSRTPREAWQAANAFENYDTRIEVGRRPVFRPRPTVATYEIGEWAGADFQDASVNSGQDIVSRVLVEGTGPDGLPLQVERTTTGTLPDRRGFRRTMILQAPNPGITTAVGQRFGDLYLQAHRSTPFRGGFQTVGQGGVRRVLGGGTVHPAHLLTETTQLVRCPIVDVDTGNWTRDARMVSVSYDHDSLTSRIALDEDRDGFNTLLARYSVVASQPR